MRRSRIHLTIVALLGNVSLMGFHAPAEAQGYSYFALTPCRVYDSRAGQPSANGTGGGAITTTTDSYDQTTLRPVRIRGACEVPTTAKAVSVNHTVVWPTAPLGGIGRLCPRPLGGGQTICRAWVLYGPSETNSNGGILPLGDVASPGTDDDIQLQGIGVNPQGFADVYTYHWTLDVTGYFE